MFPWDKSPFPPPRMEGRLKIVSAAACILIPAGAKKRPQPICQGRCRHTAVPPCFAPRLAAGCLAGCRHTRALSRARPSRPDSSPAQPGGSGAMFAARRRVRSHLCRTLFRGPKTGTLPIIAFILCTIVFLLYRRAAGLSTRAFASGGVSAPEARQIAPKGP